MTLIEKAERLSVLTGADVKPEPYDVGYWSYIAGWPEPDDGEGYEGWLQAKRETV